MIRKVMLNSRYVKNFPVDVIGEDAVNSEYNVRIMYPHYASSGESIEDAVEKLGEYIDKLIEQSYTPEELEFMK